MKGNVQIYCDMDGVLCDFEKTFKEYFKEDPKDFYKKNGIQEFENVVNEKGIEFWSDMDWMPGGQELWSIIGKYDPIILSSPSSFKFAKKGKLEWIQKNLKPQPQSVIFKDTGRKHEILKGKSEDEIKNSVLIDDYYKNIQPWEQTGGKGVLHKNINKTKQELSKFIKK